MSGQTQKFVSEYFEEYLLKYGQCLLNGIHLKNALLEIEKILKSANSKKEKNRLIREIRVHAINQTTRTVVINRIFAPFCGYLDALTDEKELRICLIKHLTHKIAACGTDVISKIYFKGLLKDQKGGVALITEKIEWVENTSTRLMEKIESYSTSDLIKKFPEYFNN